MLGISDVIVKPEHSEEVTALLGDGELEQFMEILKKTTPDSPTIYYDCTLHIRGEEEPKRIVCRAMWSNEDEPKCIGVVGKITNIKGKCKN